MAGKEVRVQIDEETDEFDKSTLKATVVDERGVIEVVGYKRNSTPDQISDDLRDGGLVQKVDFENEEVGNMLLAASFNVPGLKVKEKWKKKFEEDDQV